MNSTPGEYPLPVPSARLGDVRLGEARLGGSGLATASDLAQPIRPPRVEGSAPLPSFDENDDFNDWLDEEYGSITIGEVSLAASTVLYATDAETYRIMLNDYRGEIPGPAPNVNLDKPLYHTYPLPLAFNIKRLHDGWENDSQRRDIMVDVWEHLIRVLYAVVVGEFRCKGYAITDPTITEAMIWSDKLDTKLTLLTKLHGIAAREGYASASLSLFDETIIERLSILNKLRNGFKHTAAPTVAKAASQIQLHLQDLVAALDDVRGFGRVRLVRFCGSAGSVLNPRFEGFTGPSTARSYSVIPVELERFPLVASYLNDCAILALIGEDIFSVSPFLHFDERADHSTHGRITIYKKKTQSKANPMLTFEVLGEADNVEIPGSRFQDEFAAIRALLVDHGTSGKEARQ